MFVCFFALSSTVSFLHCFLSCLPPLTYFSISLCHLDLPNYKLCTLFPIINPKSFSAMCIIHLLSNLLIAVSQSATRTLSSDCYSLSLPLYHFSLGYLTLHICTLSGRLASVQSTTLPTVETPSVTGSLISQWFSTSHWSSDLTTSQEKLIDAVTLLYLYQVLLLSLMSSKAFLPLSLSASNKGKPAASSPLLFHCPLFGVLFLGNGTCPCPTSNCSSNAWLSVPYWVVTTVDFSCCCCCFSNRCFGRKVPMDWYSSNVSGISWNSNHALNALKRANKCPQKIKLFGDHRLMALSDSKYGTMKWIKQVFKKYSSIKTGGHVYVFNNQNAFNKTNKKG